MPAKSALVVSALSAALGVAQPAARTGSVKRVATGIWGSPQMRITVGEDGADVEHGCGRGSIRASLELDAEGRFDLKGTNVQQQPGPEREDQESAGRPARYKGQVKGNTMTVIVTLPDSRETLGPFTLTHGRTVVLRRCQ